MFGQSSVDGAARQARQDRARHRGRTRLLAAVTAALVATSLAVAPPAQASAPPRWDPPAAQADRAVRGATARPVAPAGESTVQRRARTRTQAVSWPGPGQTELDLAAAGAARKATTSTGPVRITVPAASAGAAGRARRAGLPGRVRVEVLDQAAASRAGLTGVLIKLTGTGANPGARASAGGAAAAAAAAAATDPVTVDVDYSRFRDVIGGDWASRLRLVRMPACAATTPGLAQCRTGTPIRTRNNVKAGRLTADVPGADLAGVAGAQPMLLAAAAGPDGPAGDYRASSLAPSATWQVSPQTGDFTWSYPLRVPPSPGNLDPTLALAYSSGSVDGRTVSTNNQASQVGEGFEVAPGYIERRYKPCSDDGKQDTQGDLCWAYDNAIMVLNGRATELIRDDETGSWQPKNDDGARIEKLTGATNGDNNGEHWRVTATDGTQYHFGLNRLPGWADGNPVTASAWTVPVFGDDADEPCHADTFAASWCQQAWRWNLDYVVDPDGNAMSMFYERETNYYGRNKTASAGTAYHRGGWLKEIRYGQRASTLFSATAPARVVFTVAERCIATDAFDCAAAKFTKANAKHWPDVPFDRNCDSGKDCTDNFSPTFWTRKRLTGITTQVQTGGAYGDVDTWALGQSFPASGDGTAPALWLNSITHTGKVGGSTQMPALKLYGVQLENRVDAVEGIPPLIKWRVSAVVNETGGQLSVTYSGKDCTAGSTPAPDSNARRCFPQYWQPEGASDPKRDWFHKYVVTQVVSIDNTGGAPHGVTSYQYLDGAAWHFDDDDGLVRPKRKTWSQWRGYSRVRVIKGADPDTRSMTEYRYLRGMHGDKTAGGDPKTVTVTDSEGVAITDAPALQGFTREEMRYSTPTGTVLEGVINDPWTRRTAKRVRGWGTTEAYLVRQAGSRTRTALADRDPRRTEVVTTHDAEGQAIQVNDLGDTSTAADDECTRTTYARNTAKWIINLVARTEKVSVACSATPDRPAQVISDERRHYDGGGFGAAPSRGNVTLEEKLAEYVAAAPRYVTVKTAGYDAYGRVTSVANSAGARTTTEYTPTVGLATRTTVTNPLGHVETTDVEPAWGLPVVKTDANGKRTDLAYTPLGFLANVWLPGRAKASQTPSLKFGYLIRTDGMVAVSTAKLRADGVNYNTSYELYDGQLRMRQTQSPAPGGGRVVADQMYDSRGLVVKKNQGYFDADPPGTDLFLPASDDEIPGQFVVAHDGLDRQIREEFRVRGNQRWVTVTQPDGDRVHVTPPAGGIATTKIMDARGNVTELRQYTGGTPAGDFHSTRYTYQPGGKLTSFTDPAGNQWRYRYDLRGRKISEDDPDRGTSTFRYDELDQLISSTDGRGRSLTYQYDALGRKTGLREGTTQLTEWTYDTLALGKSTASIRYLNGQAYRTEVTGYDDAYRPTGTTVTIPTAEGALSKSYSMTTEFNVDGTLHRSTMPAAGGLPAESVLFDYNDAGLPTTVRGLTTYVTSTTYSKLGQLLQRYLSAGGLRVLTANYYEEGTNRLVRVLQQRETAPHSISDTSYGHDSAGNVVRIADTPSGGDADIQCFRYDGLVRMTEAWTPGSGDCLAQPTVGALGGPAPYWSSYRYDPAGNRAAEVRHDPAGDVTMAYGYPAAGEAKPHALESVSVTGGARSGQVDQYEYDAAGNTVRRRVAGVDQALEWDAEGRISKVTEGGKVTSIVYDAAGNRLLRREPGATTLYLGGMELRLETATGKVTGTRYYGPGDETVAVRQGGTLQWLLADRQQTAVTAVDEVSQRVVRRRFTPFGQARGEAPTAWPGDRGFVGGTLDSSTGLTHLGAREYDPDIGRFISVDPVINPMDPQQVDGYNYAKSSPATYSDPDGDYPFVTYYYLGSRQRWVSYGQYRILVRAHFWLVHINYIFFFYFTVAVTYQIVSVRHYREHGPFPEQNPSYRGPMVTPTEVNPSPTPAPTPAPTQPQPKKKKNCPFFSKCLWTDTGDWWGQNRNWVKGGLALGAVGTCAFTAGLGCTAAAYFAAGVSIGDRANDFRKDPSWTNGGKFVMGTAWDLAGLKVLPALRIAGGRTNVRVPLGPPLKAIYFNSYKTVPLWAQSGTPTRLTMSVSYAVISNMTSSAFQNISPHSQGLWGVHY